MKYLRDQNAFLLKESEIQALAIGITEAMAMMRKTANVKKTPRQLGVNEMLDRTEKKLLTTMKKLGVDFGYENTCEMDLSHIDTEKTLPTAV